MAKITSAENCILWALRDLVEQHFDTRNDDTVVYNSGYIQCNREAMEILVEYGHMILLSEDKSGGRWYEARMVPREQTPNAFGRDVDGGNGDPVESMMKSASVVEDQIEHFFDESPLQKHLRERQEEEDHSGGSK
jgi:hypothetical protein